MKSRIIFGLVFAFIGLFILLVASFFGVGAFSISVIYALPLIIIGLIITFNKKEDEIEQISYSKIKKGEKIHGKK